MLRGKLGWVKPLIPMLLGVALFMGCVVWAGLEASAQLRDHDRYMIRISDIECKPPPGAEREEFISEVRYLANLPDRVASLEEGLAARVAEAFSKHPWVEMVERVELRPNGPLSVTLKYRRPVLQIVYAGVVRVVDRHGIVLPASAETVGLPVYDGVPSKGPGPVGTQWNDRDVVSAAKAMTSRRNKQ